MRIPSNKIADIISFFRKELAGIYEGEELENITWLSFNHVLGFSKSDLLLKKNQTINQSDLLKLNFICKDLKRHKPIQYVLGETEFCGYPFKVNEHVLIPRPETEELVHHVVAYADKCFSEGKSLRILDIGTGSGCIAIALKKKIPSAYVTALDVSEEALIVAQENALRNKAEVTFMKADILSHSPMLNDLSFDIVVSNPPYISEDEKNSLHERVIGYEPHLALFARGRDPLIFYRTILQFATPKKSVGVFFELNSVFAEEVKTIAEELKFNAKLINDIYGKQRFLLAVK